MIFNEIKVDTPKPKKNRIKGRAIFAYIEERKPDKIIITEPLLKKIGELADKLGVKLYVVGGYVRDYYLNLPRTDFDFTVVGDSVEFAKKLATKFKTKPVLFEKFKTAMVPIAGVQCEFVGTRKEEYLPDSRKPIVTEGALEDDLLRRDFTVNAMACALNRDTFGTIIDLYNGKTDLDLGILRTPLDPAATFSDDPLRMMRAARFAAKLNFEVDARSIEAISKMAQRIEIVSQERITSEFVKILASQAPGKGLRILHNTGLLKIIFPELEALAGVEIVQENGEQHAHKDVLLHSIKVVDNISKMTDNVWLRFAALIHDIAKPRTKRFVAGSGWSFHGHEEFGARMVLPIFRKLKLPLEHVEYVERLVRLHQRPMTLVDEEVTDSAVRRLAFHAGDSLTDLFTLCRADITTKNPMLTEQYLNNYDIVLQKVLDVQEKDKLREFQSPVRGEEIMEICSLPPSKAIGIIKSNIEDAILEGIIPNEYEPAKEYFLQNKDKWLEEIEKNGI